jgi:hypothetical protein
MQLAAYFVHTTSKPRARVGTDYKDTAAGARLSNHKVLSRITGMPAGELGHPLLKYAIPAQLKSWSPPEVASPMSVALQFYFKHLAVSHKYEVFRHAAIVASPMGNRRRRAPRRADWPSVIICLASRVFICLCVAHQTTVVKRIGLLRYT